MTIDLYLILYFCFVFLWQIAGIHPENCRLLKADLSTNYALSSNVLSEEISHDSAIGLIPLFLCATVRMKNKLSHHLYTSIEYKLSCCRSTYGSCLSPILALE